MKEVKQHHMHNRASRIDNQIPPISHYKASWYSELWNMVVQSLIRCPERSVELTGRKSNPLT